MQYYYTTAPKDPEITWRYLTPAKQAASPDYQSFWESVSTAKPKLEEWSDSVATVKLSLVLKSGKEATKTEKLTLRRERGQIKIDVGK